MMRIRQLRTRLILWLMGLLILVLGAVLVSVDSATNQFAERRAEQQLERGAKVFSRVLEMHTEELAGATEILVADYGFREAVASGDLPTIRSALANQARRIGADEALFLDAQGTIQVSTSGQGPVHEIELRAIQPLSTNALIVLIDDHPYLLVEALVMAPLAIGQVAMAFHLDRELAEEMRGLSGLEVSFVTTDGTFLLEQVSSLDGYAASRAGMTAGVTRKQVGESAFLSTQRVLLQQDDVMVRAELLSPLGEALAAFDELRHTLLIITLIALALSSLAAYAMAANLSRPVRLLADAARRIGQGDYVTTVKLKRDDELGRLASSIDTMRSDIADRERLLAYNAFHDPLTGLGNLAKTRERLVDALATRQPGVLVMLFMADADDLLKARGQALHDQLIRVLAERLQAEVPANTLVSRHPGKGFYLTISASRMEQAVIAIDSLITILSERVQIEELKLHPVWLAGAVEWPRHSDDADELLRQVVIAAADARQGPERIVVYQARRDQEYMRRMRLIRDIHFAAQMNELSVVYQPKLDLHSGRVTKVEALMRWQHSELGAIRPDEFITLAEQTGSIHKLTEWMLLAVACQVRAWSDAGIDLQVAMNISALDLDDSRFPERVAAVLQAHAISPECIAFEVTESALMRDPQRSLASLRHLRDMGISLAVDDYGTGYSSLAAIKSFPVQDLKIDKSFVLHLGEGGDDTVIVKSTIELAHNMGLRVVAEGVESALGLARLRALGCDLAQGYFISRPVSAAALEAWLANGAEQYKVAEG